jgi:hypothetical protein
VFDSLICQAGGFIPRPIAWVDDWRVSGYGGSEMHLNATHRCSRMAGAPFDFRATKKNVQLLCKYRNIR